MWSIVSTDSVRSLNLHYTTKLTKVKSKESNGWLSLRNPDRILYIFDKVHGGFYIITSSLLAVIIVKYQ